MKRLVLCLAILCLSAAPAWAQADVVANVKAELVAAGMDLSGPCGAFQITKRVAWSQRATGLGLLAKSSGNMCDGFSTDVVMYPDGRALDILIDGGGTNQPAWNSIDPVSPGLWRMPLDPGGGSTPPPIPVPGPAPVPPPALDLSGVYQRFDLHMAHLERVYLDLVSRDAQRYEQIHALSEQVKAHDEKPNPILEVLKDRATIAAIIAAVASWGVTK